mmetsp:Transcript_19056/g.54495  ORF Transcript_19056/g.54495 Transcript_19056/m.54495 type:complete len:230 (+) Transcript_19056:354-1043(+)
MTARGPHEARSKTPGGGSFWSQRRSTRSRSASRAIWAGSAPRGPRPTYASSPRLFVSRSVSTSGTTGRTASRTPAPGAAAESRRRSLTPTRRTTPTPRGWRPCWPTPRRRSTSSSATRYRRWRRSRRRAGCWTPSRSCGPIRPTSRRRATPAARAARRRFPSASGYRGISASRCGRRTTTRTTAPPRSTSRSGSRCGTACSVPTPRPRRTRRSARQASRNPLEDNYAIV